MEKKKIGLIVPSSNTMMEKDFIPRLPNDKASIHIARMFIEHTTRDEEEQMVEVYFPQGLRDLKTARVDIILFGCTSAGTLKGEGTEKGIEEYIFEKTNIPGLTVTRAITASMKEDGIKKVVLFTPYIQDLTDSVRTWLESEGFEIVLSKGMEFYNNTDIGSASKQDIMDFSLKHLKEAGLLTERGDGVCDLKADAILYSCTNFPSWNCLDDMQKIVKTRYYTSNQALFSYAMKLLGIS